MRIFLEFAPSQTPRVRARLEYAFRLFCAIQGHTPLLQARDRPGADLCITYGSGSQVGERTVRLQAAYEVRPLSVPAPIPKRYEQNGELTALRFTPRGAQPDWLAEIFEWISCADEYAARRDRIGRIAFADSYMGRHRLDPCKPYAAIAMRLLQQQLVKTLPACNTEPLCPVPSVRHFIVNTHDVDYLPLGRWGNSYRLLKNAVISLLQSRRPIRACKQAAMSLRVLLGGNNPLDQVASLAASEEGRRLHATYFFLCDRQHRRDANYDVDSDSARACMASLGHRAEIGLHGSYCSLDCPGQLAKEFNHLRRQGFHPQGARQHWLRFTLDRLIPEVEQANASYDASVGWADVIGFRAGACFAYPPYDFAEERAAHLLEVPLAVMDAALDLLLSKRANAYDAARGLLSASRQYGWGGISVLWHPTAFGGGQMHAATGNLFWRLLDESREDADTWLSGSDFFESVADRYVAAGLLPACKLAPSCDVALAAD